MSHQHGSPGDAGPIPAGRLWIRVPPEARYRLVLETAVRLYLRSLCRTAEQAPEVARELLAMVDQVAALDPVEVALDCRLPELVVSVSSGDRRAARAFRFEAEG